MGGFFSPNSTRATGEEGGKLRGKFAACLQSERGPTHRDSIIDSIVYSEHETSLPVPSEPIRSRLQPSRKLIAELGVHPKYPALAWEPQGVLLTFLTPSATPVPRTGPAQLLWKTRRQEEAHREAHRLWDGAWGG